MIHPAFSEVPDRYVAEALSEVTSPACTYLTEGNPEDYFPPEPMRITSVVAAYLRDKDGVPDIERPFLELEPGSVSRSEIMHLYQKRTGLYRELLPGVEDVFEMLPNREDTLIEYYLDTMVRQGQRLFAAHVIGRLASDNSIVDALAYPKVISRELPLVLRDGILEGTNAEIVKMDPDEAMRITAEMKDKMGPFLRQEPAFRQLGAIAATIFLPTIENLALTLER